MTQNDIVHATVFLLPHLLGKSERSRRVGIRGIIYCDNYDNYRLAMTLPGHRVITSADKSLLLEKDRLPSPIVAAPLADDLWGVEQLHLVTF